jgi:hypothetical protein
MIADRAIADGRPDHVYDVLALIRETDDTMLFGDVIKGVSEWMVRWNVSTGHMGHILPAFRQIDLASIRAEVRDNRIKGADAQIAFLIAGAMKGCMRGLV